VVEKKSEEGGGGSQKKLEIRRRAANVPDHEKGAKLLLKEEAHRDKKGGCRRGKEREAGAEHKDDLLKGEKRGREAGGRWERLGRYAEQTWAGQLGES